MYTPPPPRPNKRDDTIHIKTRKRLIKNLRDGTPCWWCGRPMHKNQQLDADHTNSVKHGGKLADRLLHSPCNHQRREGGPTIDPRRPAAGAPNAYPKLPLKLTNGQTDHRYPAETKRDTPKQMQLRKPFTW